MRSRCVRDAFVAAHFSPPTVERAVDLPSGKFVFDSTIPFDPQRVQAAAVYCSDGRLGEHVDELLHQGLGLPRYDRLAVPGGAACLAGHFATYREEEGTIEQLRFLLTVHEARRVVLIAHEGCAFYTERLRVSPLQLAAQQHDDLVKAIRRVQQFGLNIDVLAFFARRHGKSLRFERVEG
jgi:hypothetical protein